MGTVGSLPYNFPEEEISTVKNKFPKLVLKSAGIWEGEIDINAEYQENIIKDNFNIRILASDSYPNELPVVAEIGGRTELIAKKYNLVDKRDLHYNLRTGIACLCVKQEEKIKFPPGSNMVTFIDNLVIPYLYGLSYYEQYGKWPWGEYSHGGLGLLESYASNLPEQTTEDITRAAKIFMADDHWKEYSKQIIKPSPNRFCICGANKPFQKCHPQAWRGLLILRENLKRLKLNPYKLYRR